jgi:predicted transcriptional regulator
MKMKRLTKAEEEVMQGLWQYGPCTVSQLIEKMGKQKAPHSTISSIVRILEKKGFVDHKTYGRTYEYIPIIDKKEYSKVSLSRLITNYFEGSANELVSFIVKEKNLSIDELNELIDHIENQSND